MIYNIYYIYNIEKRKEKRKFLELLESTKKEGVR